MANTYLTLIPCRIARLGCNFMGCYAQLSLKAGVTSPVVADPASAEVRALFAFIGGLGTTSE